MEEESEEQEDEESEESEEEFFDFSSADMPQSRLDTSSLFLSSDQQADELSDIVQATPTPTGDSDKEKPIYTARGSSYTNDNRYAGEDDKYKNPEEESRVRIINNLREGMAGARDVLPQSTMINQSTRQQEQGTERFEQFQEQIRQYEAEDRSPPMTRRRGKRSEIVRT